MGKGVGQTANLRSLLKLKTSLLRVGVDVLNFKSEV